MILDKFPQQNVRSWRGVNRLTDRRILQIILPGFRIQSEILTDFRILKLQRFAVRSSFWVRILDFACQEVRIVDRGSERTSEVPCFWIFFVTDETHCMSRIREIVTHYGQQDAVTCCQRDVCCVRALIRDDRDTV